MNADTLTCKRDDCALYEKGFACCACDAVEPAPDHSEQLDLIDGEVSNAMDCVKHAMGIAQTYGLENVHGRLSAALAVLDLIWSRK
jgi:hypothetical protein